MTILVDFRYVLQWAIQLPLKISFTLGVHTFNGIHFIDQHLNQEKPFISCLFCAFSSSCQ